MSSLVNAATPPRSPAAKRPKNHDDRPPALTPTKSPPRAATPTRSPARTPSSDRFIPNRTSMDFDEANHALSAREAPPSDGGGNARPVEVEFRRAMRSALLPRSSGGRRRSSEGARDSPVASSGKIFRFSAEGNAGGSFDRFRSALEVIADPSRDDGSSTRTAALARPVPTKPSRILDAPDIVDDYYLNLLSWSSTNVLAVALANNVYLWNAATNEVSELLQLEQGDCVTSVAWAPGGSHLCVGTDSAAVQLWDTTRMALVRSMRGHTARVGSLAWNPVSRCVNSGSRDALVIQHDARAARHRTATLVGHQQEVCGLSWSADGS
eukprot:CAMPEP_0119274642 /NCGR_PEP_ID=MMETSP1329-20130426/12531_1 /TAXON_ID=114041 /ORGANISM="Genus nov. species nov., Strain RCC1024" /LENGTH=323 /DNA_ID=CAMNT_0007274981 /DNA_START=197 /DNA_END=1164 /DNA_ORIENTATION=+